MKTAVSQSESTKGRQPETVALIITHKIRAGEEERYEALAGGNS
jgi:hypothetical protein